MTDTRIFLVEANYIDKDSLILNTSRWATTPGFRHPTLGFYTPDVVDIGTIDILAFGGGALTGGAITIKSPASDIASPGRNDGLASQGYDGQQARVLMLSSPTADYATAVVLRTGALDQPYDDFQGHVTLAFHDDSMKLDLPLMPAAAQRFKGTDVGSSGVEGTPADLKGLPYNMAWGWVTNVTLAPANTQSRVWMAAYRGIAGIAAVYDKGAVIKPGVRYTTLAAFLAGGGPTAGSFDYYLGASAESSYVRLAADPNGDITADLIGDATVSTQAIALGDFSASTGWTLGAGWAIAGGQATATACSSVLSRSMTGLVVGREYVITGTLTGVSGGTLGVSIDAAAALTDFWSSSAAIGNTTRTVAFACFFVASSTSHTVKFTGAALTGVLCNVSCADATLANVWQAILAFGVPGAVISAADVAAINGKNGYITGIYSPAAETTPRALLDPIARDTGDCFYFLDNTGTWRLQRIEDPATGTAICRILNYSAAKLLGLNLLPTDCNTISSPSEAQLGQGAGQPDPTQQGTTSQGPPTGIPVGSLVLGYAKSWTVQQRGDLVTSNPARASFTALEFRATDPAVNSATQTLHALAPQYRRDTLYGSTAGANAERDRRALLYAGRRDALKITIPDLARAMGTAGIGVGAIEQVILPHDRYVAGLNMQSFGLSIDPGADTLTVDQWG